MKLQKSLTLGSSRRDTQHRQSFLSSPFTTDRTLCSCLGRTAINSAGRDTQDRKGDTGETASGIQRKAGTAMPLSRGRKPHPLTRGVGVD